MSSFKKDDPVTVIGGSNWLVDKKGFIVKIIDTPVTDPLVGDENRNIVVTFPDIPVRQFMTYGSSQIPEEEWSWVYFESKHLVLGHAPLTFEEQVEKELSGFGHSMKPWAKLFVCPDRKDYKCVCGECNNFASSHIWINVWGSGYRFNVCTWHAEEYNLCSCREDIPFKTKKENLTVGKVA